MTKPPDVRGLKSGGLQVLITLLTNAESCERQGRAVRRSEIEQFKDRIAELEHGLSLKDAARTRFVQISSRNSSTNKVARASKSCTVRIRALAALWFA